MTTILLVDDDEGLLRTLAMNLRARDYDVLTAGTGEAALAALTDHAVDVMLLDLGLPGMSGVEVLRRIDRGPGNDAVPVIVLSARHGSEDKVQALDLGADDYVTKPFGIDELLARVRAAVRRGVPTGTDHAGPPGGPHDREPAPPAVLDTGELRIDLAEMRVHRDGAEVRLTPIEWGLLRALASRPGRLVGQRRLLQDVWGPAYGTETHYLRVHMANLRRKLEQDPSRPRHLITEPGMGYRFVQ